MTFKDFIRRCLSESDGSPSFGRTITIFIVGFVLGWDTYFVIHAKALPDATIMAAQGLFMVVFYGANKAAGAFTANNAGTPAQGASSDGGR